MYYKHRAMDGKRQTDQWCLKRCGISATDFKDKNSKLEIMEKYSILHKWMFNILEMNIFILQLTPKNWDSLERHS